MTLLIVVTQSYLILQNLFQGLIWFIVPVSMIVINDVMAYLFGFFFGRTQLIKLSPKKTWEGFIGGGISTVILGALLSHALCKYPYFVCPVEYSFEHGIKQVECRLPHLFQLTEYEVPANLRANLLMAKLPPTITLYPFVLHSLALSTFSSIIAPFGGFFASGFKRAFKMKDFGDLIPGHGGLMDRFDCQFLMATFVNVYISSFISAPNPDTILYQIYQLKPEHQIIIFEALKKNFQERQII